jgi:hypothetical protein
MLEVSVTSNAAPSLKLQRHAKLRNLKVPHHGDTK